MARDSRLNWRQLAVPQFSGVNSLLESGASTWDRAFSGARDTIDGIRDRQIETRSNAALPLLAQVKGEADVDGAINAITNMVRPQDRNATLNEAMMNLRGTAMGYDTKRQALANSRAAAGRAASAAEREAEKWERQKDAEDQAAMAARLYANVGTGKAIPGAQGPTIEAAALADQDFLTGSARNLIGSIINQSVGAGETSHITWDQMTAMTDRTRYDRPIEQGQRDKDFSNLIADWTNNQKFDPDMPLADAYNQIDQMGLSANEEELARAAAQRVIEQNEPNYEGLGTKIASEFGKLDPPEVTALLKERGIPARHWNRIFQDYGTALTDGGFAALTSVPMSGTSEKRLTNLNATINEMVQSALGGLPKSLFGLENQTLSSQSPVSLMAATGTPETAKTLAGGGEGETGDSGQSIANSAEGQSVLQIWKKHQDDNPVEWGKFDGNIGSFEDFEENTRAIATATGFSQQQVARYALQDFLKGGGWIGADVDVNYEALREALSGYIKEPGQQVSTAIIRDRNTYRKVNNLQDRSLSIAKQITELSTRQSANTPQGRERINALFAELQEIEDSLSRINNMPTRATRDGQLMMQRWGLPDIGEVNRREAANVEEQLRNARIQAEAVNAFAGRQRQTAEAGYRAIVENPMPDGMMDHVFSPGPNMNWQTWSGLTRRQKEDLGVKVSPLGRAFEVAGQKVSNALSNDPLTGDLERYARTVESLGHTTYDEWIGMSAKTAKIRGLPEPTMSDEENERIWADWMKALGL